MEHLVGDPIELHYAIAVNTLSTGPPSVPCQLVIDGNEGSAVPLPYGQVISGLCAGKWYRIQGAGNNVTFYFGLSPMTVTVTNITATANITGPVDTNSTIVGQTVGVAPSTTEAGPPIDPRNIRPLVSSDLPGDANFTRSPTAGQLPSALVGGGLNTRALTASDILTPYGSGGKSFLQDSLGNLQHVPVLQGSSTPISGKALQYDANNYPLHTIGNITSNGGDAVAEAATSGSGNTSLVWSVPSSNQRTIWQSVTVLLIFANLNATADWTVSFQSFNATIISVSGYPFLGQAVTPQYTVIPQPSTLPTSPSLTPTQIIAYYGTATVLAPGNSAQANAPYVGTPSGYSIQSVNEVVSTTLPQPIEFDYTWEFRANFQYSFSGGGGNAPTVYSYIIPTGRAVPL